MELPRLQAKDCIITLKPVPVSPTELLKQFFCINEDFDALEMKEAGEVDIDDLDSSRKVVCAMARAAKGDVWACCTVTLTITWRSFSVSVEQGSSCSWDNEAEFKDVDMNYVEMVDEAFEKLQELVDQAHTDLKALQAGKATQEVDG